MKIKKNGVAIGALCDKKEHTSDWLRLEKLHNCKNKIIVAEEDK